MKCRALRGGDWKDLAPPLDFDKDIMTHLEELVGGEWMAGEYMIS